MRSYRYLVIAITIGLHIVTIVIAITIGLHIVTIVIAIADCSVTFVKGLCEFDLSTVHIYVLCTLPYIVRPHRNVI